MQSIGDQLGGLFLGAAPIALIILFFYLILRALFFKPLLKVMAEREARSLGAQKAAEASQALAAEKVKSYQEALKQARAAVYLEQEAARKKLLDERNAQVKTARGKASAEVDAAKARIRAEAASAQRELEAGIPQLANEIVGRILTVSPGPGRPSRGAR